MLKAIEKSEYDVSVLKVTFPDSKVPPININKDQIKEHDLLSHTLKLKSELVKIFEFHLTDNLIVEIVRQPNEFEDVLRDKLPSNQNQPVKNPASYLQFISLVKQNLNEFFSSKFADSIANKKVPDIFKEKIADFSSYQDLLLRGHEKLQEDMSIFRQKIQDEFESNKKQLEEVYQAKKEKDDTATEEIRKTLKEKTEALNEREKQLDDRNSKHVRRQIRDEIKKNLQGRSEKFHLTSGTRRLRLPIHIILISLITVLVFQIIVPFLIHPTLTSSIKNTDLLILGIKSLFLGAAIWYYIRWQNAWFQKHADEEFNQKAFELDLDRASWLVEMAMEWQDEKGTEIPEYLVDKLSKNLFTKDENETPILHPADQLASALMGSSSSIELNTNGNKIKLDRKGIKTLKAVPPESKN